ncbi:MAG: hypothetical protein A4E28_01952 [Methanocella sp. PtaU1.Bin125]|nr:MAG: hypothetical protein A4E28_01952 [Methanocella sp. PtaU1.Bin125]
MGPLRASVSSLSVAAVTALLLILLASGQASAHMPIIEKKDTAGFADAIHIRDPAVSWAIYGFLEKPGDADYYYFDLEDGLNVYTELLVPVSPVYEEFRPSYAIVGPGVPGNDAVPFETAPGSSALVVDSPGGARETFYEPFGGITYYKGIPKHTMLTVPGRYYVVVYDDRLMRGDYVLAVGEKESFRLRDLPGVIAAVFRIRTGAVDHSSIVSGNSETCPANNSPSGPVI